jgi:hypothetical protein
LSSFSSGIVASGETVTPMDYGYGLLSFLTVAFGGLAIGVLMGLVSGLLTRATREVRIFAFLVNILSRFTISLIALVNVHPKNLECHTNTFLTLAR